MKVLVTGGGGFIGSHLVQHLLDKGRDVVALVRYTSGLGCGHLPSGCTVVYGDVRDSDVVMVAARDCDVIYHLAALITIPYSYEAPRSYVDTNVIGTQNILGAARRYGVRCIVTSSSEVYGSAQTELMTEDHPLHPQSPYAASKVAADALAVSYAAAYDTDVRIVRPFNTYGPRQSTRALIPTIITKLGGGVTLGSLWPERDYLYVDDTVRAFILAGESNAYPRGTPIHFGTGECYSVAAIAKLLGAENIVSLEDKIRPTASEVSRLCCDNTRARALGWKPLIDIKEGLKHVSSHNGRRTR